MRTLNFSILFVYFNFNKFPSSDFRVHWNARNSEKRTRKWRLLSSLERGIRIALWCNQILVFTGITIWQWNIDLHLQPHYLLQTIQLCIAVLLWLFVFNFSDGRNMVLWENLLPEQGLYHSRCRWRRLVSLQCCLSAQVIWLYTSYQHRVMSPLLFSCYMDVAVVVVVVFSRLVIVQLILLVVCVCLPVCLCVC